MVFPMCYQIYNFGKNRNIIKIEILSKVSKFRQNLVEIKGLI